MNNDKELSDLLSQYSDITTISSSDEEDDDQTKHPKGNLRKKLISNTETLRNLSSQLFDSS